LFYKAFAQARAYFVYGGCAMSIINKKAFTLIELLVVVLIIGILAAIALPQYQAAVEKSKASEALIMVKALKNAQDMYFLATGNYPTSFDDFDISIPNITGTCPGTDRYICVYSKNWDFELWKEEGGILGARNKTGDLVIGWYPSRGAYRNTFACAVSNNSANAAKYHKLCKSLNGVVAMADATWTYYALR
jgi:prepilin-type N-terminal cleavage/methylation domain-containing protein